MLRRTWECRYLSEILSLLSLDVYSEVRLLEGSIIFNHYYFLSPFEVIQLITHYFKIYNIWIKTTAYVLGNTAKRQQKHFREHYGTRERVHRMTPRCQLSMAHKLPQAPCSWQVIQKTLNNSFHGPGLPRVASQSPDEWSDYRLLREQSGET